MKKFLAMAITLILLASCMMLPTFAAEGDIVVYDYEGSSNGEWLNGDKPNGVALDSNTSLIPGKTVLTKTYTKPFNATWGYPAGTNKADYDQITMNYTFASAVDISEMTYLALDVYSQSPDLFGHRFIVELTSSGKHDNEENNYAGAFSTFVTPMGDNWYRVEIPIASIKTTAGGGLDKTACDFMRFYYDDGFGTPYAYEGESFTFGVKKVYFTNTKTEAPKAPATTDNTVTVSECNTMLGWVVDGATGSGVATVENSTAISATYNGVLWSGWLASGDTSTKPSSYKKISMSHKFSYAYDITEMEYLRLELYVSDPAAFNGKRYVVELTAGGTHDNKEANAAGSFDALAGKELVAGWNSIEIPMSKFTGTAGGGLDKGSCNFLRMYYDDPNTTGYTAADLVVAVRKIGFSKLSYAEENEAPEIARIVGLFNPIKDIKKGDITAENYETVKAQFDAASAAYAAASESIQEAVREQCSAHMVIATVRQAISTYEESLENDNSSAGDNNGTDNGGVDNTPTEPEAADSSVDTEPAEKKKGCGSSVAGMSLVVVLCAGAAVVFGRKKEENI